MSRYSIWSSTWRSSADSERVLTVRRTLENDLKVARQPKQRSRRGNVEYGDNTKFRSPLVMVEWWRIAMDEVRLYRSPQSADVRSRWEFPFSLSNRSNSRASRRSRRWFLSCPESTLSPSRARQPEPRLGTFDRRYSTSSVFFFPPANAAWADILLAGRFLRQFHLNYFQTILGPGMAGVFEKLFKVIATRTTKAKVQQELTVSPSSLRTPAQELLD